MRQVVNFGIIALIAAAIAFLPGGGETANVIGTLLAIAFGLAIGFFGYRLYREQRFTIESLEPVERLVLYASIGLAFLAFTGYYGTLQGTSAGILVLLLLIAVAAFGVFWVFTHSRRYN